MFGSGNLMSVLAQACLDSEITHKSRYLRALVWQPLKTQLFALNLRLLSADQKKDWM